MPSGVITLFKPCTGLFSIVISLLEKPNFSIDLVISALLANTEVEINAKPKLMTNFFIQLSLVI